MRLDDKLSKNVKNSEDITNVRRGGQSYKYKSLITTRDHRRVAQTACFYALSLKWQVLFSVVNHGENNL